MPIGKIFCLYYVVIFDSIVNDKEYIWLKVTLFKDVVYWKFFKLNVPSGFLLEYYTTNMNYNTLCLSS